MWIFTRYGFFSAVCARQGDGGHGQPVDKSEQVTKLSGEEVTVGQFLDEVRGL